MFISFYLPKSRKRVCNLTAFYHQTPLRCCINTKLELEDKKFYFKIESVRPKMGASNLINALPAIITALETAQAQLSNWPSLVKKVNAKQKQMG